MRLSLVDVYVLRRGVAGLEALVLRRAAGGRSPGSWECVHGHIDDGEAPVQAARRELREEAGCPAARLYNLSRVEMFYSHRSNTVALIPAFVAFVADGTEPVLSREHDRGEWLPLEAAAERLSWPRLRRGLGDAARLFGAGDAGVLEDVLGTEA